MSLSIAQKLQKGIELKNQGNEHYKNNDIKKALFAYNNAVLYLSGLDNSALTMFSPVSHEASMSDQDKVQISTHLLACYSNMAACYLKTDKFEKTIVFCDKVLKANDKNAKALFRKGQALFNLNQLDKSKETLRMAVKSAPNDVGIRDALAAVSNSIAETDRKYKQELIAKLKF